MVESRKLTLKNSSFFFAYLIAWVGSLCALAMNHEQLPRWLLVLLVVVLGILAPGLSDIKHAVQRLRHRKSSS